MQKIILAFILLLSFKTVKAQQTNFKYLDSTCEWRYYLSGTQNYLCTKYFDGDTIIQGSKFFRVCASVKDLTSFNVNTYSNLFFMGEDSNHNFIVPNLNNNPPQIDILYNFKKFFDSTYVFSFNTSSFLLPKDHNCFNYCSPLDGYLLIGLAALSIHHRDTFQLGTQTLRAYSAYTLSNLCNFGYNGIIEGIGSGNPNFASGYGFVCNDTSFSRLTYFDKQNNRISFCNNILHDSFPTPVRGIATSGFYNCQQLLPLKLLSFTAKQQSDNVFLSWQTTNEIDVSYFNIQRSFNSKDFTTIGKTTTKGFSYNEYGFVDMQPLNGENYYKIESVDRDGKKQYSEVRTLTINHSSLTTIDVYPNPTTGYVYIDLPNKERACWQITATDIYGKRVAEKEVRANIGKTFINLKGTTGIYFINVLNCSTGKQQTAKVILQ